MNLQGYLKHGFTFTYVTCHCTHRPASRWFLSSVGEQVSEKLLALRSIGLRICKGGRTCEDKTSEEIYLSRWSQPKRQKDQEAPNSSSNQLESKNTSCIQGNHLRLVTTWYCRVKASPQRRLAMVIPAEDCSRLGQTCWVNLIFFKHSQS